MKKKLLMILLCLFCSGLFAKVYFSEAYDSVPKLIVNFNNQYPTIDLSKYDWKIVTETENEYDFLQGFYVYKNKYRIVFVADLD